MNEVKSTKDDNPLNSELNGGFMSISLQQTLISYLTSIRDDSADPERVDKLIYLVEAHKETPLEKPQAYSEKIAGLVNLLFIHMPEVKKADPELEKVYPLADFFEKELPKKRPKGPRPY